MPNEDKPPGSLRSGRLVLATLPIFPKGKAMSTGLQARPPLGEALRRQREAVGMRVTQLAKRIGASRNTIGNYEAGRTTPPVSELVKIAQALGCGLPELIGEAPAEPPVRFAFRAHKKIAADPEVRVAARRCFQAYREIEEIMEAHLDSTVPDESFDPDDVRPEQWIPGAAARCQDLLGVRRLGPRRIAPLLERLGVRTLFFDFAGRGLDGISAIQDPMSLVMLHRRTEAVERTITNAAHELGHLVLHPHLFRAEAEDAATDSRDYESEAKLFARHLLVPTDDLLEVWVDEHLARLRLEHALLLLKQTFRVSYWLLYQRVHEEGLTRVEYPQLVIATKRLLGIQGRAKMEALEPEPMAVDDLEASPRFHHLVRSAFLQEKIGVAKVAELLQTPIDEAKETTHRWLNPGHATVE